MQAAFFLSGLAAIIFAQLRSVPLKIVLASMIFLFVTTIYVGRLFGVPPLNIEMIAGFIAFVRPLRSPEYIVVAIALATIPLLLMFAVPKVPTFTNRTQYLFAAVLVGIFIVVDTALPPVQAAGLEPPRPGEPVDAATRQVNFTPKAAQGRHVLVIVVEALGVPLEEPERKLFRDDWNRAEWREKYEVTTGTNRYAGSTTFGELRELCGISADYQSFDFATVECLPSQFAQSGYGTTAIHTFRPKFFNRESWYPQIGFQNMMFRKELLAKGVGDCPGVFPGACDVQVAPIIFEKLKNADKPQFVYWLTLNTHTPVVADPELGTERCTLGSEAWRNDFPAVCRLYELHHLLADSVSKVAMNPDLPPTDILIVGDHKPFIYDHESNLRFSPDRVPWVLLRAK